MSISLFDRGNLAVAGPVLGPDMHQSPWALGASSFSIFLDILGFRDLHPGRCLPEHRPGLANSLIDLGRQAGTGSGNLLWRATGAENRLTRAVSGCRSGRPDLLGPMAGLDSATHLQDKSEHRRTWVEGAAQKAGRLGYMRRTVSAERYVVFRGHVSSLLPGYQASLPPEFRGLLGRPANLFSSASPLSRGLLADRWIS
jgi:hypothetical protein